MWYNRLHKVEVMKTQLSSSSVKEIWKKGENNAISLQLLLCQGKIALFIRILPATAQQFSWAAKVVTCSGQVTWFGHVRTTIMLSGRSWSGGIWADPLRGGLPTVRKMYFMKYEYIYYYLKTNIFGNSFNFPYENTTQPTGSPHHGDAPKALDQKDLSSAAFPT